jgi:hypothetical protein
VLGPLFLVGALCHALEQPSLGSVCFVIPARVNVEVQRRVSIGDRHDLDALALVVLVLCIFPIGSQAPSTIAALDALLKSIVVCLLRATVLLVGAVHIVQQIRYIIVSKVCIRPEIHRDTVVAILVVYAVN